MIKSFAYTVKSELERSRWLYAPIEPFLAMETASKTGASISHDCNRHNRLNITTRAGRL